MLVTQPMGFDKPTRDACDRMVRVMTTYPELIGGTSQRLDTEVMRAARGRVVSKVGAEGVYTAGIKPCEEWPNGFGLARSEEHTSELQSQFHLVCRLLLEKKK